MAKRRRLTPPQPDYLEARGPSAPGGIMPPPIAQVVAESAEAATLRELADTVATARAEGRLLQALPLDRIDADYLVRDRVALDEDDLGALVESLRARGQQTAIEVVALDGERYGLISGWRRLCALRKLFGQTGEARFGTVLARITRPESAGDAYLAMVEENEIRVGLSYYERARIVVKAVEAGVFPHDREALSMLYGAATRSRRSKIKSFIPLVRSLDSQLRFPAEIGERLGLEVSRRMASDPGFAESLSGTLLQTGAQDATAEQTALKKALTGAFVTKPEPRRTRRTTPETPSAPAPGGEADIALEFLPNEQVIRLKGAGVTDALHKALQDWLQTRKP